MIDFTHTKRPDFIQLILIIAVACLALGAITPAASALEYDWDFSVQSPDYGEVSGTIFLSDHEIHELSNALPDGSSVFFQLTDYETSVSYDGYAFSSLTQIITNSGIYTNQGLSGRGGTVFNKFWVDVGSGLTSSEVDVYVRLLADFLVNHANLPNYLPSYGQYFVYYTGTDALIWSQTNIESITYSYDSVPLSYPFSVDVVDSENDYLISVSGIDDTQLAGSAYTIAVSTYSGGYNLPLTSFPMYLGDSPVHLWTTDQTFTLPVYLSDGVTPIDYYCMLSFPADPTYTGYPFWWNLTVSGSSGYPFDTNYPPVVPPTPTPLIPSDIIPDPESLNNTVNITGWYQDQGYEGNNITAPIYSGLRGFFTETLIPFYDFFLTPIGSLASVITDSAGTSKDAIYDSVDQLSVYAAPMNMVGGYVVLLVPDVVWVVVFAALTIGYAVLLIRISTGSIRDTINRFLGGR